MTYDPSLFAFSRLIGSAKLGWSLRLGESRLGLADDTRSPVPIASLSIKDGYTADGFALSLDPATATATISTHEAGAVVAGTPTMRTDDPVEATYGGVVVFDGICTKISVTVEPDPDRRGYTRRSTYTLASAEAWLLAELADYPALPAEPALTRLRRWLTVDASALVGASVTAANVTVDPVSAGTKSLLELARDFTAATGLALRVSPYSGLNARSLTVLEPTAAAVSLPAADTWATSVSYDTTATTLRPNAAEVEADNTVLMSGVSDQTITAYRLGTTFRLGTARLGTSLTMRRGFLAGDRINIFGQVVTAGHVSQTFTTEHYRASLELVF